MPYDFYLILSMIIDKICHGIVVTCLIVGSSTSNFFNDFDLKSYLLKYPCGFIRNFLLLKFYSSLLTPVARFHMPGPAQTQ